MSDLLDRWTYRTTPTVVFGRGCLDELPDQVRRIADGPVLIVTDKGLVDAGVVERVTHELARAGINVEVWDEVQPGAAHHQRGRLRRGHPPGQARRGAGRGRRQRHGHLPDRRLRGD